MIRWESNAALWKALTSLLLIHYLLGLLVE